jgi:hypothetical protein
MSLRRGGNRPGRRDASTVWRVGATASSDSRIISAGRSSPASSIPLPIAPCEPGASSTSLRKAWRLSDSPAPEADSTVLNGAPVWSTRFAEGLGKLVCHPLVLGKRADFAWSLIEAALQFAVLCRTDERSWDMEALKATFGCPVLKTLRRQVEGVLKDGETLHERHVKIRKAHKEGLSLVSDILYHVGEVIAKMGLDKTHPGRVNCATGTVYVVKTSDVKAPQDALDALDRKKMTCAAAFEALCTSHDRPPWPEQLPTHRELCDLIRGSAMVEERYWRRKALLPAVAAADQVAAPTAVQPAAQRTTEEDLPSIHDAIFRLVRSSIIEVLRISWMPGEPRLGSQ